MKITKAVITAAGKQQRTLPLQTLVDRDGEQKTALLVILEEVVRAGIDEVGIVLRPGDEGAYREAALHHAERLRFITQDEPLGYGHAVHCAREFTDQEAFLLLVGDHIYVSDSERSCAKQLIEVATPETCSVSAVHATNESKIPFYGVIGGRLEPGHKGLFQVENVIEKPTPTEAEQHLIVPGLRAAHYLCFFGMHVLTPMVMEILEEMLAAAPAEPNLPLTPALARLAARERYLAAELEGSRYDIGRKYGLLTAQLALAIDGKDREEILAHIIELLAHRIS